jgi:Bacterial Ig-like domain
MDKETIIPATFTLTDAKNSKGLVEGTVELIGGDTKFTPSKPLNANSKYTAKISKYVKDLGGNPLTIDKTWSFTTA